MKMMIVYPETRQPRKERMPIMEKSIIAELKPAKVHLKAGKKYFWCACGRSSSQPFCDGSHRGTGLSPVAVSVDSDREAFLCQCKATGNAPYCDGTHSRIAPQSD